MWPIKVNTYIHTHTHTHTHICIHTHTYIKDIKYIHNILLEKKITDICIENICKQYPSLRANDQINITSKQQNNPSPPKKKIKRQNAFLWHQWLVTYIFFFLAYSLLCKRSPLGSINFYLQQKPKMFPRDPLSNLPLEWAVKKPLLVTSMSLAYEMASFPPFWYRNAAPESWLTKPLVQNSRTSNILNKSF